MISSITFNFKKDGNIVRAVSGDTVGTVIGSPSDQ